jgi:hypothetical protein
MMDGIKITKKGLGEFVKFKLQTDMKWSLRALVVVYEAQDDEEKMYSKASKRNKIGFNKVDAKRLTYIAEHFSRYKFLSEKSIETVQRLIPKYWNQILNVCDTEKLEGQYRRYIVNRETVIEQVATEIETPAQLSLDFYEYNMYI